jgi:uncharacterized membrane protein YphA (DoxX/SURF4 family)
MAELAIPRPVEAVLALPGFDYLARMAVALPFLVSGVVKLLGFSGAVAEVTELGLRPTALVAAAAIATQIGGSLLFLTRRWCWLGAGMLAVFTAIATLIAHPFWSFEGEDRGRQTATVFEHVAIVGGLAMAALSARCRERFR